MRNVVKVGVLVGLGLIYVSCPAFAETPKEISQKVENSQELLASKTDVRARLRSSNTGLQVKTETQLPSEFSWAVLTKNGPASGADPIVGEGSGKAFYNFRDGIDYPYYVQPQ